MRGREADEERDLALHDRLVRHSVVDGIPPHPDLERRHAEIPPPPLRDRQVEPHAAVGNAAVIAARDPDVLLDDELNSPKELPSRTKGEGVRCKSALGSRKS